MRTLIFGAVIFLLWIFFARWHYVCQIKGICGDQIEVAMETRPSVEMDEEKIKLEEEEQFVYEEKEILPDLNQENKDLIANISTMMKADDQTNLIIQGAYTSNEKDVKPGFFENLGLARADAVRKMLVEEGIDEERISLDFTEDEDALANPIRFETTKDTKAAEYTFTNMSFSDISFASESAVFNPNRQFNVYADSLKTYLNLNPEKRLVIIGHTDDRGEEELNHKLGRRRAHSVRYYLEQRGIKTPIEIDSKGELAPIADNKTTEGRRKNRRVQITIR